MSTFAVTIERIAHVWAHPNADRLDLAKLGTMTFQFAIPKGAYTPGELVVYLPLDSVLPLPLTQKLGLEGKLSGKEHDRIKTVRLRGEISQGIVAKIAEILPDGEYNEGDDVTAILGVEKFEPPPVMDSSGTLLGLPTLVGVYDIEGADRFPDVASVLMDVPVIISEKVEGSHFAATLYADGTYYVSQRRYRIEPVEGRVHTWWKAANNQGMQDKLAALLAENPNAQAVTLRGELVGPSVQGNIYKLPDHRIYLFEAEIDGQSLSAVDFVNLVDRMNWEPEAAPILLRGECRLREWLADRSVAEASNGHSLINAETIREGIVIRPATEGWHDQIGRLIIKQRSPEYLVGADT